MRLKFDAISLNFHRHRNNAEQSKNGLPDKVKNLQKMQDNSAVTTPIGGSWINQLYSEQIARLTIHIAAI